MKLKRSMQLGALEGVFVPTFLSIIGVILFLRLGYIVGSAGLLGTILIIILAISVTIATGISLSSITTNIRIGRGGAYSIVTKTLGLEVGGSVGIPLYLAQLFSVALYLFGFMEGWLFVFPDHSPRLILLGAFIVTGGLITMSTRFAVRTQMIVAVVMVLALASIFLGANTGSGLAAPGGIIVGNRGFWMLFALFFPATTGLMAGIGLSGKLADPKRQIPLGVMSALTVTTIIYLGAAVWFAFAGNAQALTTIPDIVVTHSFLPGIVVLGLLLSTFSSSLTTVLAAPHLLNAMGDNGVLPKSKFFAKRTNGEPHNAIIFTLALLALLLAIGSLDTIAPVLTMFFLITYAMINLAVYLEKSLGSVSFRPTMRIPPFIPLYGTLAALLFMLMINPYAAVLAVVILFSIYIYLAHQQLTPKSGDARSGLFTSIAKWAAQKAIKLPEGSKHNWKPSILLPVVATHTLLGNFPVIKSIAYPNGTMTVLGLLLAEKDSMPEMEAQTRRGEQLSRLPHLVEKFGKEDVFTSSSIVEVKNYTNGICIALESIESQVLHPNLLFLPFKSSDLPVKDLERIFEVSKRSKVGVILLDRDDELGLGSEHDIHVWISDKILGKDFYHDRPFDLGMILAYRLFTNWDGKLTIWMATTPQKKNRAERYLKKLIYEARFPHSATVQVMVMPFERAMHGAPDGDLHIVPMTADDIKELRTFKKFKGKTFMFVSDSGNEDILA